MTTAKKNGFLVWIAGAVGGAVIVSVSSAAWISTTLVEGHQTTHQADVRTLREEHQEDIRRIESHLVVIRNDIKDILKQLKN